MASPSDLPALWRTRAREFRRYGQDAPATMLEGVADELDESLRAYMVEALSLRQAADESGYTPEGLSQLIRRGRIANVNPGGHPKVRRCDLPRKPGPSTPRLVDGSPDLASAVLAGLDS